MGARAASIPFGAAVDQHSWAKALIIFNKTFAKA